ncbi:UDP-glucose dehydrogenase family protein [Bacillus sp. NPDC094106]|uniref:UDP-glucose dehydrogenase family protein n=1 Tax=Bacillus sp. NPDC094106 TaxID=3363949 RepID=UPI00380A27AC
MNILVIGTGYVGTTTALVFAEQGHQVMGLDIDEKKISSLKAGKLPFFEDGLEELLCKQLSQKNIIFTTNMEEAIQKNEMIYICVGTPSNQDGSADLTYVEQVARAIGTYMNEYKVIVTKSTVPVGTAEKVTNWIMESKQASYEFDVVSNPEFLREGSALYDALHPDRIVVGASSTKAFGKMKELFHNVKAPYMETTQRAAELIKYAANSFLALKISYMNELARLCEKLDVNVKDISRGIGLDKRIGTRFLEAGIGYGGSCFPKDTKSLLNISKQNASNLSILESVVKVNKTQPLYVLKKIRKQLGIFQGKTITVLGLSFKPNTDDIRESPSLTIINYLVKEEANVRVHDPIATISLPNVYQFQSVEEASAGADAIIICTNWAEYKSLQWDLIRMKMRVPFIFDGRNCLDAQKMKRLGFMYQGVGYC